MHPAMFTEPVLIQQAQAGGAVRYLMRKSGQDPLHAPLLSASGQVVGDLRRDPKSRVKMLLGPKFVHSDVHAPDGTLHLRVEYMGINEVEIRDPDGKILAVVFAKFSRPDIRPMRSWFEFHTPAPERYRPQRNFTFRKRGVAVQLATGQGGRITDDDGRTLASLSRLEEHRHQMRFDIGADHDLRPVLVGFLCSFADPAWVKPPKLSSGPGG